MVGIKRSQGISTRAASPTLDRLLALNAESDVFVSEETVGLSSQQWLAIRRLVQGRRQNEIADELGITPETVSRWRNHPIFIAALNLSLRDAYTATIGEVREAACDAVAALRNLMRAEDEKVRLSASLAILRMYLQLDSEVLGLPMTPSDAARNQVNDIKVRELRNSLL